MIWLSNSTLARLRDQLRARGQRPSLVVGEAGEGAELAAMKAEYGPLVDAMYVMMSADGRVTNDERDVLKGALRNLSGDEIRSVHVEAMVDAAAKAVTEHGRDHVMKDVIATLHDDTARAEVTFVLAAAIAFADGAVADEENETLNALAEGLGIGEARANELLDSVDADLSGASSA